MQKTAKRKNFQNFYQIALNVFFAILDCTSEIIRLLKLCVHSWPNRRNFCYSAKLKLTSIDLVALTMYSVPSLCNITILWYILERITFPWETLDRHIGRYSLNREPTVFYFRKANATVCIHLASVAW